MKLTISKQIPQKNKISAALTNLWEMLQREKILENEVQENKKKNCKLNLHKNTQRRTNLK